MDPGKLTPHQRSKKLRTALPEPLVHYLHRPHGWDQPAPGLVLERLEVLRFLFFLWLIFFFFLVIGNSIPAGQPILPIGPVKGFHDVSPQLRFFCRRRCCWITMPNLAWLLPLFGAPRVPVMVPYQPWAWYVPIRYGL